MNREQTSKTRTGSPAERAVEYVLLALAVAGGAFLRFYGLGSKPFWAGEVQEIVTARSDRFWSLLTDSGSDFLGFAWHHLLYLLSVQGELEFWHRFLAATCSTLTIPVVYLLGRRVHSPLVGSLAAAAIAFSFVHVYHGQDARSLAGLAFGATLTCLALIRIVFDARASWLPALLVGTAALALSHVYGLFLFSLLAGAFFLLALHAEGRAERDGSRDQPLLRLLLVLLPAAAVAGLEAYPIASFFQFSGPEMVRIDEFPEDWLEPARLRFFPLLATYFTGAGGICMIVAVLLVGLGVLAMWIRDRRCCLVLGCWFFVPALLFPAARLAGRLPHFDAYHLGYLLPAFWLYAAAGLHALASMVGRRVAAGRGGNLLRAVLAGTAALALIVSANASPLLRYERRETRLVLGHDFRSLARFVEDQGVGARDGLAFVYADSFFAVNFYLGRLFHDRFAISPWTFENEGIVRRFLYHSFDDYCSSDIPILFSERVLSLDRFARDLRPYTGTIWLVVPAREPLTELPGFDTYGRWFDTDELYLEQERIQEEELPPGFHLQRFAGVDLAWKTYGDVPRRAVVRELGPLLMRHSQSGRGYDPHRADP
jgi:hypothetical protein